VFWCLYTHMRLDFSSLSVVSNRFTSSLYLVIFWNLHIFTSMSSRYTTGCFCPAQFMARFPPRKWPIMCRVGRETLFTHSLRHGCQVLALFDYIMIRTMPLKYVIDDLYHGRHDDMTCRRSLCAQFLTLTSDNWSEKQNKINATNTWMAQAGKKWMTWKR